MAALVPLAFLMAAAQGQPRLAALISPEKPYSGGSFQAPVASARMGLLHRSERCCSTASRRRAASLRLELRASPERLPFQQCSLRSSRE